MENFMFLSFEQLPNSVQHSVLEYTNNLKFDGRLLKWACKTNRFDTVKYIIEKAKNGEIILLEKQIKKSILACCKQNNYDIYKYLYKQITWINLIFENYEDLYTCCEQESIDVFKECLEKYDLDHRKSYSMLFFDKIACKSISLQEKSNNFGIIMTILQNLSDNNIRININDAFLRHDKNLNSLKLFIDNLYISDEIIKEMITMIINGSCNDETSNMLYYLCFYIDDFNFYCNIFDISCKRRSLNFAKIIHNFEPKVSKFVQDRIYKIKTKELIFPCYRGLDEYDIYFEVRDRQTWEITNRHSGETKDWMRSGFQNDTIVLKKIKKHLDY